MKRIEKIKKYVFKYCLITIGVLISALALQTILIPNGLIDGGVTGVSLVLAKITPISVGVFIVMLNVPLLLYGLKTLKARFTIKAGYAMLLYAISLELFKELQPIIHDKFIATIFGGCFLGLGVGIVMYAGGCMDGTEVIAVLLDKKTELSVGQAVLIFNIIIFSLSSFVFGFDKALYSLTAYFISCKVIDKVSSGFEQMKVAMIVTDNSETNDIADNIYKTLGRTVTTWDSKGYVTKGDKKTLYLVLTRVEISDLKDVLDESKSPSFVSIFDANEIVGNNIIRKSKKVLDRIEKGN